MWLHRVDFVSGYRRNKSGFHFCSVPHLCVSLDHVITVVQGDLTDVSLCVNRTEEVGLDCEVKSPNQRATLGVVTDVIVSVSDTVEDDCNVTLLVSGVNHFDGHIQRRMEAIGCGALKFALEEKEGPFGFNKKEEIPPTDNATGVFEYPEVSDPSECEKYRQVGVKENGVWKCCDI